MSFFRSSLFCIKAKPRVAIPYKVFVYGENTSQNAKGFHILFISMGVEELQHFMGVTQLCRMRLLRTPHNKIKIMHC